MWTGKTSGRSVERWFSFQIVSWLLGIAIHVVGHGENVHDLRIEKPVKNVGSFPPWFHQFPVLEKLKMLGQGRLFDVGIIHEIVDALFWIIEIPENLHPEGVSENLEISCGAGAAGIRSIEQTFQIVLDVILFHHRLLFLDSRTRPAIDSSWLNQSSKLSHFNEKRLRASIRKFTMF